MAKSLIRIGMGIGLFFSALTALGAAPKGSFFPTDAKETIFVLKNGNGEVPKTIFLDDDRTQRSIASYVKGIMREREATEERKNKITDADGLAVIVMGVVFNLIEDAKVELRLIGDLRERIIGTKVDLADLEAGREVTVTMGPSSKLIDLGFYITATTTARTDIRLSWDAKSDSIKVPHAYGKVKVVLGNSVATTEDGFEFKDLQGTRGVLDRQPVETDF